MPIRQLVESPRPWHLLLGPAVPMLALLKNNTGSWTPDVVIGPALTAAAVAVLLWLALTSFVHDRLRAALAVTFSMLAFMSHLSLLRLTLSIGAVRFVPLVYLGILIAAAAIVRSSRPAIVLTVFTNRALLATVLLLTIPIVWGEAARARTVVEPLWTLANVRSAQRPDVYVLILDGYARADVLREVYGFDNPLIDRLRTGGFFVAERATANYAQTALSLASAFNLDYLPQLGHPVGAQSDSRRGLGDLIQDNRFFKAFEDAGYDIRAYGSEYTMLRPGAGSYRRRAPGHLDEFGYSMLEATALPSLFEAVGLPRGWLPLRLHRHHLRWTLADLAASAPTENDPPRLVLAHLLAPHPPFAVDAEGGIRDTKVPALLHDGSMWRAIAQQSGESYKAGYVDGMRYLNDRIEPVARALANRPFRPAIILIHSDHGPGLELEWERPAETNMRERMGVLLAVRYPEGRDPGIDERATLVNVYRSVLNRALGVQLPLLENHSYFSTWSRPFAYIDVTGRLDCNACGERTQEGLATPPEARSETSMRHTARAQRDAVAEGRR
jgi:Sulfatase